MEQEDVPPRSFPLTSLDELRSRSFFESPHFEFNKSSVPLPHGAAATSRLPRPRLLACHDLKGGYVDDQWVQGSNNANAYTLTHWRLLDSFVYFSHNLVTIPPPGWTNAAHLHGVQVLGTFITEWEAGTDVCKELLASEESARMYADRLAELAEALGFDGWLVNIENAVPAELCGNLKNFVAFLTSAMHEKVPDSLVIWYDAVTIQGKLSWQDRLNGQNKPFFDVCDGLFVNYTWKRDYPKQCAVASGDRPLDIYMGVDVFGRNTYGGGRYQCDVALNAAREAGVSAALFAPGWAYETGQDEKRWWDNIESCWPAARPDPIRLPFFTDFNIGHGRANFVEGNQVSDLAWNNLASQNLQPLLHVNESAQHLLTVSRSLESPTYGGGVSISMAGNLSYDELCVVQLYDAHATVHETFLRVSYSVATESGSQFCLALSVQDENNARKVYFLLDSRGADKTGSSSSLLLKSMSVAFIYPERYEKRRIESRLESGPENDMMEADSVDEKGQSNAWNIQKYLLEWGRLSLKKIFGICTRASEVRPFLMSQLNQIEALFLEEAFGGKSLPSLGKRTDGALQDANPIFLAKVGHVALAAGSHEHVGLSDVKMMGNRHSWSLADGGNRFLSLNLDWRAPSDDGDSSSATPLRYHLYAVEGEAEELYKSAATYLGMTSIEMFNVFRHPVSKRATAVTFKVDIQCRCGKIVSGALETAYTLRVPSEDSGHFVRSQPSLNDWLFKELQSN